MKKKKKSIIAIISIAIIFLLIIFHPITFIGGKAYFTYTSNLDLEKREVTSNNDINALKKFVNVKTLWLTGTQLTDISFLYNMQKLDFLVICPRNGCKIADLSPLSSCTSLTRIMAGNLGITDLHIFKDLNNLENLNLYMFGKNNIWDISDIKYLTKLKGFYVNGAYLTDLSPLTNICGRLERLKVTDLNISDISIISKLDKLKLLDLERGAKINDISALSNLNNLENLDISKCTSIADFSPLLDMPNLKTLYAIQINIPEDIINTLKGKGVKVVTN